VDNEEDAKLYNKIGASKIAEVICNAIVDDDVTIIKNKIGLADETIKYLQNYKYGSELIRKIANAVK